MKIALATIAIGSRYQRTVRLGVESKREYCRRHGYDFLLSTERSSDRPPAWEKIPLLSAHIDRYDAIFWSDADVLITNPLVTLESIIARCKPNERTCIILSRDAVGNVNTGNFFLFRRPEAGELLDRIWQREEFIDHRWWENMAMIRLLEEDAVFASRVHIEEDPALFNAYPHKGPPHRRFRRGDLLIHFAGVTKLRKLKGLMRSHYVLDRAVMDRSRFALALLVPHRILWILMQRLRDRLGSNGAL